MNLLPGNEPDATSSDHGNLMGAIPPAESYFTAPEADVEEDVEEDVDQDRPQLYRDVVAGTGDRRPGTIQVVFNRF